MKIYDGSRHHVVPQFSTLDIVMPWNRTYEPYSVELQSGFAPMNRLKSYFSSPTFDALDLDMGSEPMLIDKSIPHVRHFLKHYDSSLNYVEAILIFVMQLSKARDNQSRSLAIIGFLKMMLPGKSLTQRLIGECLSYWTHLTSEVELESFETFVNYLDDKSKDWDVVRRAPVFTKLHKFFMFALVAGLFSQFDVSFKSLGYSKLEEQTMRMKFPANSIDMVECFSKTSIYLLKTGIQVMKYGDYSGLFHSNPEYAKLYDDFSWLSARKIHLSSITEDMDFTESSFLDKLNVTLDKYKAAYKHLTALGAPEAKLFYRHMAELERMSLDLLSKRVAQKDRAVPFSVLIHSPPGRGKTTLTDMLFKYYGKKTGEQTTSNFRYIRNGQSDFWDAFRTEQWCVIMDDIAFMNPNIAKGGGDPSASEFIQVINSMPFVPNQAHLDDKGRIPLRAKLVIGTTNTRHLNSKCYYAYPSAVLRRFPFVIDIEVKDEFATTDGQLDQHKANGHIVPNFWNFVVTQVELASEPRQVERNEVLRTSDVGELQEWYGRAIDNHLEKGEIVKNSLERLQEETFCSGCQRFSSLCRCNTQLTLQSFFDRFRSAPLPWYTRLRNRIHREFERNLVRVAYLVYMNCWTQVLVALRLRSAIMNVVSRRNLKDVYRKAGSLVEARVKPTAKICLVLSGLVVLVYMLTQKKAILQTGDNFAAPEPKGEEHENVWYQSQIPVERYEVSSKAQSMTFGDFSDRVSRNTARAWFVLDHDSELGSPCRLINIGGTDWMTTAHCIPNTSSFEVKVHLGDTGTCDDFQMIRLSQVQVARDDDADIAVLRIPQLGNFKSLVDFIPRKGFRQYGVSLMIARDDQGKLSKVNCVSRRHTSVSTTQRYLKNVVEYKVQGGTGRGTCGCPVIMDSPGGSVLYSMHCAGPSNGAAEFTQIGASTGWGHALDRDHISRLRDQLKLPMSSEQNFEDVSLESTPVFVKQLHPKSAIHYIGGCFVRVYGALSTGRARPKSGVRESLFHAYLSARGWVTDFTVPVMRSWKPWNRALSDLGNPVSQMDLGTFHAAYEMYLAELKAGLPPSEVELFHPLDHKSTINGQPGVAFIDAMNRKSSAGFPWKRSKRYVTIHVESEPGEDLVDFDDEVLDKIELFRSAYACGKRAGAIFNAHLKDEAVSAKKRAMGKTRVFTGAPLPYSYLMRQYFMSSVRVMQRNRFLFESMVGVVAQSPEWDDLYKYIVFHGDDKIVAGDYKAFDKRMPSFAIQYAFEILIELSKLSGKYKEEDLLVMRGLATDTAYPLVDFNGDLLEFIGSNPSGHPLTVIINSLVNSLYMRYCYIELSKSACAGKPPPFRTNVHLATYGDDNIMGVKCNWFNHTAIAAVLEEVGITYTMADKEAESIPFINISQASFLKRTWRLDDGVNYCPLEWTSVVKSMMLTIPSKMVTQEIQMTSVLDSFLRESFFHGECRYSASATLAGELLDEYDLRDFYPGGRPPTYSELQISFLEAGRKEKDPILYSLGVLANPPEVVVA